MSPPPNTGPSFQRRTGSTSTRPDHRLNTSGSVLKLRERERQFVADVRAARFTPHVAQNNTNRRSAIDGRTTRHAGYTVSQRIRKRVEEPFGWIKTVGAGRKLRYIGNDRNRAWFKIEVAVHYLIRITTLDAATA